MYLGSGVAIYYTFRDKPTVNLPTCAACIKYDETVIQVNIIKPRTIQIYVSAVLSATISKKCMLFLNHKKTHYNYFGIISYL